MTQWISVLVMQSRGPEFESTQARPCVPVTPVLEEQRPACSKSSMAKQSSQTVSFVLSERFHL